MNVEKIREALDETQKLAARIVADVQPEIDRLVEERDAARARSGRMRTALDEAEATISQMRIELREPLELRGTMESAIRAAIFRADYYLRNRVKEPAQDDGKPDGAELIRRERERQKNVEGWTPEHDDKHIKGELGQVAACYAMPPKEHALMDGRLLLWPDTWHRSWWKPSPDNRVRELSKAGALISAEIDRLMRAAEVKRRLEEAARG